METKKLDKSLRDASVLLARVLNLIEDASGLLCRLLLLYSSLETIQRKSGTFGREPEHCSGDKAPTFVLSKRQDVVGIGQHRIHQSTLILGGAEHQRLADDVAPMSVSRGAQNIHLQRRCDPVPLVCVSVLNGTLNDMVCKCVARELGRVAQHFLEEIERGPDVSLAWMVFQKTTEHATTEAMPSCLDARASQLFRQEFHVGHRHHHDDLLQHVVGVLRMHRLPHVSIEGTHECHGLATSGNHESVLNHATREGIERELQCRALNGRNRIRPSLASLVKECHEFCAHLFANRARWR